MIGEDLKSSPVVFEDVLWDYHGSSCCGSMIEIIGVNHWPIYPEGKPPRYLYFLLQLVLQILHILASIDHTELSNTRLVPVNANINWLLLWVVCRYYLDDSCR